MSNLSYAQLFWWQILGRHLKRRKRLNKVQDEKINGLQSISATTSKMVTQVVGSIARRLGLPEEYALSQEEVETILTKLDLLEAGNKHSRRVGNFEYRMDGNYVLCTQLSMKKLRSIGQKTKLGEPQILATRAIAEDIIEIAQNARLIQKNAREVFAELYEE